MQPETTKVWRSIELHSRRQKGAPLHIKDIDPGVGPFADVLVELHEAGALTPLTEDELQAVAAGASGPNQVVTLEQLDGSVVLYRFVSINERRRSTAARLSVLRARLSRLRKDYDSAIAEVRAALRSQEVESSANGTVDDLDPLGLSVEDLRTLSRVVEGHFVSFQKLTPSNIQGFCGSEHATEAEAARIRGRTASEMCSILYSAVYSHAGSGMSVRRGAERWWALMSLGLGEQNSRAIASAQQSLLKALIAQGSALERERDSNVSALEQELDREARIASMLSTAVSEVDESGVRRPAIPEDVRHEVWRRDRGRCSLCGGRERLEFDHIIPVSKGGSNTARNIQLLCEACNREKTDRI